MSDGVSLLIATRTHVGRVRQRNEDALLVRADAGLVAVADGMGGHDRGDWASSEVVRALAAFEAPGGSEDAVHRLIACADAANATILAEAGRSGRRMGSTLVALLVRDWRCDLVWAGDSRAYRLRGDRLTQLSRDHTQVAALVAEGLLSPHEAGRHPLSNVLTRAVGVVPALALERTTCDVKPGDTFLLCSDGLTGEVADDELTTLLADAAPEAAADRLLSLALDRGGRDNVTFAIVRTGMAAPAFS